MAATILVADDHPAFRAALVLAVRGAAPDAAVVEAGTLAEAVAAARGAPGLVLVLLDLGLPGAQGVSGVAALRAECPDVPILVVSAADPGAAGPARALGAVGFVSKSAELADIESAIARALAGDPEPVAWPATELSMAETIGTLTPTERRVLSGVLRGQLNKQIAHELGISEATVKGHMTALMRKLGVHNRTQAVLAARALGLALPG
ncbi:MAG: LuxR C-terminal-related transcriptional regulator [Thermaurantiacus tibetensis]|uniref:response regulator transcription factor n=1 Tax=Thermaurantiacus tibetensis TaxID=2759035 RepID=UPI00188E5265|nr:response regulator transcription factor [Thermaurantiacus tibetensis]